MSERKLVSLWAEPGRDFHAGPKARRDIQTILVSMGAAIEVANTLEELERNDWHRSMSPLLQDSMLVLQYPMRPILAVPKDGKRTARYMREILQPTLRTARRVIVIVHDIKTLQSRLYDSRIPASEIKRYLDETEEFEQFLFVSADVLITHSTAMKHWIQQKCGSLKRGISLVMFDYLLARAKGHERVESKAGIVIAVAGNLARRGTLDVLLKALPSVKGISYRFYGIISETSLWREDTAYHGTWSPDRLSDELTKETDYGLVWGRMDDDEMAYYQIAIPHKVSLYISAGIRVIAPANTYVGRLVERLNVGITIDSLAELPDAIARDRMSINFSGENSFDRTRTLLNAGRFTERAISRAVRLAEKHPKVYQ